MTIYAEIKHPIDSRELYDTIGMNVTDIGSAVLVYGEPANPVYVVAILIEYGAELIQIRG